MLDIVRSGFLEGPLLLPRFVLRELQLIADTAMRSSARAAGAVSSCSTQLQETTPLEIVERDFDDIREVDAKLVRLAQERGAKLVTNDYNLNRVAHVEGVAVLNVNELANAVKPVLLPGEELRVAGDPRGPGGAPGRRLPRRRHDDRGRERPAPDRRDGRRGGDERAADRMPAA